MKWRAAWMGLAVAALAACGSGGGGGDDDGPSGRALDGVAWKGPMANAVVEAFAVDAGGGIGATALATGQTDASGRYELDFDAEAGQPYVIRVRARDAAEVAAAGGVQTTHLDEATGQPQALPAGFALRALYVPDDDDATASVAVTPFSEIAVAAAQKAEGGIGADSAAQASAAVAQLLGFDPRRVEPVALGSDDASADQQRLAVLLAAVSRIAAEAPGDVGCAGTTGGEATACVAGKLGDAADAESIRLRIGDGDDAVDVSAAIAAAVTEVLAESGDAVDPTLLAAVRANLACTRCDAVLVDPPGGDVANEAIADAKDLFAQIRTDLGSMFTDGGIVDAPNTVNGEAFAFREAMREVQLPAESLVKTLGAMLTGVDLYNDVKAGRTGADAGGRFTRSRAQGLVAGDPSPLPAVGCTLYQDAETQVPATTPENANVIGCSANYYVSTAGGETVRWRHGFALTPTGDGAFAYVTNARRSTDGNVVNELLAGPFEGTLTTSTNGAGRLVAFGLDGELAPAFAFDANELVHARQVVDLAGTRSFEDDDQAEMTMQGSLVVHAAAAAGTAEAATLTIRQARLREFPVDGGGQRPADESAIAGGTIGELTMDALWETDRATLDGVLALTDAVWDLSGTHLVPTQARLEGTLSNVAADGTVVPFATGTLTVETDGYDEHDETLPDSADNAYRESLRFEGTITARDRPTLRMTLAAEGESHRSEPSSLTMQYSIVERGSTAPRNVVDATVTRGDDGRARLQLAEVATRLSMTVVEDADSADLIHGDDLKVGELDLDSGVLTFTNNEFISVGL